MKKKQTSKKYKLPGEGPNRVGEAGATYRSVKVLPAVIDFPYKTFAKIAALVPFNQREWASILHLSEKTLQRYAKDNKNFEGIYVDRILQMEELIKMGLEAFTSANELYLWLKKDKPVLGNLLNFDSLRSSQGIQLVSNEIGRILHGVYI
jgi:putative toxin-antitoxin system antitoxin component (TIGR02293 family)